MAVPTNKALTIKFQQFLDCKAETSNIAEQALTLKNDDAYKTVMARQDNCLKVIAELTQADSIQILRFQDGIAATQSRIALEKTLLTRILSKDLSEVSGSAMALSIIAQKERQIWENIEKNIETPPFWRMSGANGAMSFGWIFFVIIGLLLLYKGKLNLNSEKVRLYFENQSKAFRDFLAKILKSNKK